MADTRPAPATVGPRSAPLAAGDTHTIDAQQSGTDCSGVVPNDAAAVALNVTALGATDQTFLTIWPGGPRPEASSLNPAPGAPPTPNAVNVELSVDREFDIYNDRGSVNVVVDITGYYVDHDHDDRYLTAAEVDEAIAGAPWSVFLAATDFAGWGVPGTAQAVYSQSYGSGGLGGLHFESDESSRASAYLMVPANHREGADIAFDIQWFGPPASDAGCRFSLQPTLSRHRDGALVVQALPAPTLDGPLINPTVAGVKPDVVSTATLDGVDVRAGDILRLGLRRAIGSVDTCDDDHLTVIGVTARST